MDYFIKKYCFLIFLTLLLSSSHSIKESSKALNTEESADLFEGDIVIPAEEEELLETGEVSAGVIGSHYRWDHATIPYEISEEYKKAEVKILEAAMEEIMKKTCIRFEPRGNERNYIIFRDGKGCSSQVGRQLSLSGQAVTLSRAGGCVAKGTAIHELVHAIGFWHEQSRTDRDDFVTIKLDNVPEDKRHNFDKYTTKDVNDFGVPYDYDSVMHYPDRAFISTQALRQNDKTIVPKNPKAHIGQRKYLSKLDALKINRMYNCPGLTTTTTSTPRNIPTPRHFIPFQMAPTTPRLITLMRLVTTTTTTTTEKPIRNWLVPETTTAETIPKIVINALHRNTWQSRHLSAWKRKQLAKYKNLANDDYYDQSEAYTYSNYEN